MPSLPLTDIDKSSSVPHLTPNQLSSNPDLAHSADRPTPTYQPMTMLEYDRPRTASESFNHRPRVSSWSQHIRPRSSSHGQKHQKGQKKAQKNSSSRESVQSSGSEYIDMQMRASDKYVEMSPVDQHLHHHHHLLHGRGLGPILHQTRKITHPPSASHHHHSSKCMSYPVGILPLR